MRKAPRLASLDLVHRLPGRGFVPLAWRNLTASKRRLLRSSAGIAFAVLLMMVQLGFERAFFDASLAPLRLFDGDMFVMNASKYRVLSEDPFPPRDLEGVRRVAGAGNVAPLYYDWLHLFWKGSDGAYHLVQVIAFDPEHPVLADPEIDNGREALKREGTVMIDRKSRSFLGMENGPPEGDINGTKVSVVGSFALGPDFEHDGTVVMSDRTFARLLTNGREPASALPIELGVVKLAPGQDRGKVEQALRAELPKSLVLTTRAGVLADEERFQNDMSSAAPIFWMGTFIGFVVGILISYQIIYTDLSDNLPQYATLKGMGYGNGYLVRIALEQAALAGLAGFLPAWILCLIAFRLVGAIASLPLRMSLGLTAIGFGLTIGMCLLSAAIAVRRLRAADPAEIF